MRKKPPAIQELEAGDIADKPSRWQATALAVGLALAFAAPSAWSLALGRLTVQSALGEPLRAEIDIPEITAEEAASLRASVAGPDAFRAAGMEYNAALATLQVTLQRRADGRTVLRLSSDRAVNEPFVDLILEANWASGRIVRDYTLLFDPPAQRQPAPAVTAAAVTPSAAPAPAAVGARQAPAPATAPATTGATPSAARPAARPTTSAAPAPAGATSAGSGSGQQVTVKAGDTAGKLAAAYKPASVSLDQMLVALLRTNPDAFIAGNVNRLRAGAVLDMPSAEQASGVSPSEASQTVVAQARDFNEFRRKLAEAAPGVSTATPGRQASGAVQARVEERKPAASAPDKLTLSKGAVAGATPEARIASQRQAQDAASRVAELTRNISDLNKAAATTPATPAAAAASGARPAAGVAVGTPAAVAAATAASAARPAASAATAVAPAGAASRPAGAPGATPVATPVAVAASAPAATAASAPVAASPAVASASAAATTSTAAAAAAASAPVAAAPAAAPAPAPKPPAPPPPPPPPEPSFVDEILGNPFTLPAAGLLLAALAGLGVYRARQRRKATQVDSSFLESRLQPDSFFGASGGQRVDTNDSGVVTGSSMVYSPSQLDAAGDVDPVAEADVYLAYGRDLQAEEILKEALRTNPQRVAIHGKLLEIYAKRRDAKAFEVVATEAYGLTQGEGPVWERICELGRELEASNPLYQPGGQPAPSNSTVPMQAVAAAGAAPAFAMATAPQPARPELAAAPAAEPAAAAVDLDLDLDFSLGDDEPPAAAPAPRAAAPAPQASAPVVDAAAEMPPLEMDFGSAATVAMQAPAPTPEPVKLSVPDLALSANSLSFTPEPVAAPAPKAPPPPPPPSGDGGMIEFDLGSLSLDLPGAATPAGGGEADPLETKLALAEEFRTIGDTDGARSLIQEVIAEGSGSIKTRAQKILAELS